MSRAQSEGEPIIDFMAKLELDSLLSRGTITYEGKDHQQSTIDLTLTSSLLAEDHLRCGVYPQEHGSDHRAIETWYGGVYFKKVPHPQISKPPILSTTPTHYILSTITY
jgi:hypothetical protein